MSPFRNFLLLLLAFLWVVGVDMYAGNDRAESQIKENKRDLEEMLHDKTIIAQQLGIDAVTTSGMWETLDVYFCSESGRFLTKPRFLPKGRWEVARCGDHLNAVLAAKGDLITEAKSYTGKDTILAGRAMEIDGKTVALKIHMDRSEAVGVTQDWTHWLDEIGTGLIALFALINAFLSKGKVARREVERQRHISGLERAKHEQESVVAGLQYELEVSRKRLESSSASTSSLSDLLSSAGSSSDALHGQYFRYGPPALLIDCDGLITEANPRMEKASGYSESEMEGEHIDLLIDEEAYQDGDSERPSHAAVVSKFVASMPDVTQPLKVGWVTAKHKDGHLTLWELVRYPVVKYEGGEEKHYGAAVVIRSR